MAIKGSYRTKHKEELQKYLESTKGSHFSASDIYDHFKAIGHPMGKTTVYRQLEDLVSSGEVKKFIIDENTSACYEYAGSLCSHSDCIHMKCEKCNRLFHLECSDVLELEKHILAHHNFRINRTRTVLYGLCSDCDGEKE